MKRLASAALVAILVFGIGSRAFTEESKEVQAILDKAIKAAGIGEKLGAGHAVSWKTKGKLYIGGNENEFVSSVTIQGLHRFRGEFEGDFGGQKFKGITVLNGEKGWRRFGDMGMELDADALANERRNVYLQLIPATLVPLKGKGFKLAAGGDEKVGDAAATAIKVTVSDGKDFTIYFDKATGHPVKQVAQVRGFMGEEFTQETVFAAYKDFGGIKRATKIESKRDGERFVEAQITEFKIIEKVDPKTFAEPE